MSVDEMGNEEGNSKLVGLVKAKVENNIDEMGKGRIQIRIPAIHGGSSEANNYVGVSDLPWADPCMAGFANIESGSFLIPPINSLVWVGFENGDDDNPVYLGGVTSSANPYTPSEMYTGNSVDSSKGVIFKTPHGHSIYYDSDKIEIDGKEGQQIKLIGTSIQLINGASKIEIAPDYIELSIGGTTVRLTGDALNMIAPRIDLNP
jgi:hypothetical protein